MNKKVVLSVFLSLTMVLSIICTFAHPKTVYAATVWNNKADISWIDPSKKIIAFAFDDGPITFGRSGMKILDTLEKYHMHGTFFYQGNRVNPISRIEMRRAHRLGFEIGNHTFSHPYLTELTTEEIQNEIERTNKILRSITKDSTEKFLVRPPYLETNQTVLDAIDTPLITCSIDVEDYSGISSDEIIERVLNNAEDGTIMLMHETYDTTAEAVAYLVPELINRGYVITSVSELFKIKGVTATSGQVYSCVPGNNIEVTPSVPATELTKPIFNWPFKDLFQKK